MDMVLVAALLLALWLATAEPRAIENARHRRSFNVEATSDADGGGAQDE